MTNKTEVSRIAALVACDVAKYEASLIYHLAKDLEFYLKVSSTLCVAPLPPNAAPIKRADDQRRYHNEFSSYALNYVYYAIRDYMELIQNLPSPPSAAAFPPSPAMLKAYIGFLAKDGNGITEHEIVTVSREYEVIINSCNELYPAEITYSGFGPWLMTRRLIAAAESAQDLSEANTNTNELLNSLIVTRDVVDQISTNTGPVSNAFPFGAGFTNPRPKVHGYSTGIPDLDKKLGGGFVSNQSTLVVAGSGVGKTVFATNVCWRLAAQGLYGIYISTEQPHYELEPRFAAAALSIQFERIKDNFDPYTQLDAKELEEFKELWAQLKERVTIYDWMNSSESLRSLLPRRMEEFREAHGGRLDFVITDWLGGGLGETDPDRVRYVYQATADYLAKLPLISIAMAQAHTSQAYNNPRVGQESLSECKSMGRGFYNVLGLTGFRQQPAKRGGAFSEEQLDAPLFLKHQLIHIDKSRGAPGGFVKISRTFQFQRIDAR